MNKLDVSEARLPSHEEMADSNDFSQRLNQLGEYLDHYLTFRHSDAMEAASQWQSDLQQSVPQQGVGMDRLLEELGQNVIANGSPIPRPGCTAFITTGASHAGLLAELAGSVASPQRIGLTAFQYLEELSLQWLVQMLGMSPQMKGLYSSGGSVANLVALGGARQWAFEQVGIDPAAEGVSRTCRIYATEASHHTIHRAAGVLGLGRQSVIPIACDEVGRMLPEALQRQLRKDRENSILPVAVVANAGATSTGTIDPLRALGEIARQSGVWFHVDGAYGLPGILDPSVAPLYDGLALADSVIVDPHKWLGAPVGIGATFVRDRSILNRAFTQEASDYLEGSFTDAQAQHSMDSIGVPYSDMGVELSAPARGVVVWAILKEIGEQGLRQRVCRHNAMARWIAETAQAHPRLELLQRPTLSICCFRYVAEGWHDLNELNRQIHRRLVHGNINIPSTAMIENKLAIRPCFVGARTGWKQAEDLVNEVVAIGDQLTSTL